MGWDANSSTVNTIVNVKTVLRDFKKSMGLVLEKCNEVDGLLSRGMLSCTRCGKMLGTATGKSVYVQEWDSQTVKELNNNADWNFKCLKKDLWAKESAKEFLKVCAKYELKIKFSW